MVIFVIFIALQINAVSISLLIMLPVALPYMFIWCILSFELFCFESYPMYSGIISVSVLRDHVLKDLGTIYMVPGINPGKPQVNILPTIIPH